MPDRPRILFLTLYPEEAASPRYRVHQFLPYLEAHGFACTVASALAAGQHHEYKQPGVRPLHYHIAETRNRVMQVLQAAQFDIVFVQKAMMSAYLRGMAGLLRLHARRIVVDVDDAVHLQPPHPLRRVSRVLEDRRQPGRLFKSADLVLAGNAWLRDEAARYTDKVVVFPTVVDTGRFSPAESEAAAFRFGWIGNPSTFNYMLDLEEVLTPNRAELLLIGAPENGHPWPGAEYRKWDYAHEVDSIRTLSVGLMPLHKDAWCQGKCGLKALQYMACGVPCIATPWGAANDIIEHNVNGLLADHPAEWHDCIERLRDTALRKRLGDAARRTVVKRYSLAEAAPNLVRHLESIL